MAPLADNQFGVCLTLTQVCTGVNGWKDPNYNNIIGYEINETVCDGIDNDCDGEIDEGGVELCRDGIDNDCDDEVDEIDCSGLGR
jgi:hypothetical protein